MRKGVIQSRKLATPATAPTEYPLAVAGVEGTVIGQHAMQLDWFQSPGPITLGHVPVVNPEIAQRGMGENPEQGGVMFRNENNVQLWERLKGWRDQHEFERAFSEPSGMVEFVQMTHTRRVWAPPQMLNTIPTSIPEKTKENVDHLRIRK